MAKPTNQELLEEAMATRSTEKRPLWAVAAEEWDGREWGLIIRYNHATCEAQARITYIQARMGQPFRIIATAKAIGFKVMDNKGLILAA